MENKQFYTFPEYMKKASLLSASEEDYLEMIYRICIINNGYTRVNDLANALNVKPPSVSNMLRRLANKDLIKHFDYGTIELTTTGNIVGKFLLERHNIVESFLKLLNIFNLEETEKIEHTISEETLNSIKRLVDFFYTNNDILNLFNSYIKKV